MALQRWLLGVVMYIVTWSFTYMLYWVKHEATLLDIALFLIPILILPIVCSAYGEVNYEGKRMLRVSVCVCVCAWACVWVYVCVRARALVCFVCIVHTGGQLRGQAYAPGECVCVCVCVGVCLGVRVCVWACALV